MRARRLVPLAMATGAVLAACLGIALAGPLFGRPGVGAGGTALSSYLGHVARLWLAWWPEVVMLVVPVLGTALIRLRG